MNKTILFATGNARKIAEANATLQAYNLTVESIKVDIEEIQHQDPTEITIAKVRAAFAATNRPVVVSDTSWAIPALGGFPGGYMKDVSIWWKAEDWLAIMALHDDKRIFCHEHVAYYDGVSVRHFMQEYEGHFIEEARGRIDDYEAFEQVAVMYGNETMAEQLERGDHASAGEKLGHWEQFGTWYAGYLTDKSQP